MPEIIPIQHTHEQQHEDLSKVVPKRWETHKSSVDYLEEHRTVKVSPHEGKWWIVQSSKETNKHCKALGGAKGKFEGFDIRFLDLAHSASLHPSRLSRWINGAVGQVLKTHIPASKLGGRQWVKNIVRGCWYMRYVDVLMSWWVLVATRCWHPMILVGFGMFKELSLERTEERIEPKFLSGVGFFWIASRPDRSDFGHPPLNLFSNS